MTSFQQWKKKQSAYLWSETDEGFDFDERKDLYQSDEEEIFVDKGNYEKAQYTQKLRIRRLIANEISPEKFEISLASDRTDGKFVSFRSTNREHLEKMIVRLSAIYFKMHSELQSTPGLFSDIIVNRLINRIKKSAEGEKRADVH